MHWLALVAQAFAAPAELSNDQLGAPQLIDAGNRYFKQGETDDAVLLWKKAATKGALPAKTQYDLARGLLLLRRQGKTCQFDAYPSRILTHLAEAIADPQWKARFANDPDMRDIRETVRGQILLGADLDDRATLTRLVVGRDFWSVFSPERKLRLDAAGALTLSEPSEAKGIEINTPKPGTWRLDDDTFVLDLPDRSQELIVSLGEDGNLVIGDGSPVFLGTRRECQ